MVISSWSFSIAEVTPDAVSAAGLAPCVAEAMPAAIVCDPAGNQYHRLSSAAYRFVGLLDGSRTVAEAWDTAGGVLADDAPTQPEVVQILSQLHAANLLEANITADAGVLLLPGQRYVLDLEAVEREPVLLEHGLDLAA